MMSKIEWAIKYDGFFHPNKVYICLFSTIMIEFFSWKQYTSCEIKISISARNRLLFIPHHLRRIGNGSAENFFSIFIEIQRVN